MMTTITVEIPDRLHDWVESRAKTGHYDHVADYVRALIEHDQARASTIAEVQTRLDEGLASGISDRSMSEVLEIARARVRDKSVA